MDAHLYKTLVTPVGELLLPSRPEQKFKINSTHAITKHMQFMFVALHSDPKDKYMLFKWQMGDIVSLHTNTCA